MKIADAAELHTTWAARFNAKDLDGMVALAETDSVFVRNQAWWLPVKPPYGVPSKSS